MNTRLMDKLLVEKEEILKKLRSHPIVIHTRDNWWDAIPESYQQMKQLQAQITTSSA